MTYVVLSVVVLALLAVCCLPVLRHLPRRPLVLTALALIALTVVFDNIIVGVGIVDYDESLISGVTMPIAPIEDLAYALGAVLLVPTIWELLGGWRPRHRPDGTADPHGSETS
ncbi:lycopene cyclase domain-containing protein [Demequina flava]|uniref:lycopene cyclase domain-containing protein n=1 Tax=Demequina flava TaxID=1095025 RepID=UPI0007818CB1|nr:lycopene cyclase domain-containing protein [Demequina flava]